MMWVLKVIKENRTDNFELQNITKLAYSFCFFSLENGDIRHFEMTQVSCKWFDTYQKISLKLRLKKGFMSVKKGSHKYKARDRYIRNQYKDL